MQMQAVEQNEVPAGAELLLARLRGELAGIRPLHPVSILDVSPGAELGVVLTRLSRGAGRKLRIMTYAWSGPKLRESFGGPPEPMVEKGDLPGLHFSPASFDFVMGVDVLGRLSVPQRNRALAELTATALRAVFLVHQPGGGLREAELRDALFAAGLQDAPVEAKEGGLLSVRIPARAAAR